jgi:transcriptional regulator with XRE-family HTH domain
LLDVQVLINAEALKAIRTKDGQSMATLARAANISRQYLNDIEKKRRGASPDVRRRLAAALNVPTSAIEAQLVAKPPSEGATAA